MTAPTPSTRRQRQREATVAEIKDAARRLLATGGPPAISLRAIARDMAMTAPAIYRYFPSLDALVNDLAIDVYNDMRAACEAARDAGDPDRPPLERIADMARALRRWALDHRAEFALILGSPVPGVTVFDQMGGELEEAGARFGAVFLEVLAQYFEGRPYPQLPAGTELASFSGCFDPYTHHHGTDLPPVVVLLFLAAWTRIYGLVAMEVFGHLGWAMTQVEPLFELELAAMLGQLAQA